MTSTGLYILTSDYSTGSFETASLVGGVENQLSVGRQREWRQIKVLIDFVLLEHDLFGRPNLLVWGGYVIMVLWSCAVLRTGR